MKICLTVAILMLVASVVVQARTSKSQASAVRRQSAELLRTIPGAEVKVVGNHGTPTFLVGRLFTFAKPAGKLETVDLDEAIVALAPVFGISPSDIRYRNKVVGKQGDVHYKYDIVINGKTVLGARMIFHVDVKGKLFCINGSIPEFGEVSLPDQPGLTQEEARMIAEQNLGRKLEPTKRETELSYILSSRDHETYLAYVFASGEGDPGTAQSPSSVYVDAMTGRVVDEHLLIHRSQYRKVYDPNGNSTVTYNYVGAGAPPAVYSNPGVLRREEGDPASSYYYVDKTYDSLGVAYAYYNSVLGYSPPESQNNLRVTTEAISQALFYGTPWGSQYGADIAYLPAYAAIVLGYGYVDGNGRGRTVRN